MSVYWDDKEAFADTTCWTFPPGEYSVTKTFEHDHATCRARLLARVLGEADGK